MSGAEDHPSDSEPVTEQIRYVASKVGCGIGEARDVIRAQPIASALIIFGLGYLFGRLGALIPSRY